jgi:hypothetical protein
MKLDRLAFSQSFGLGVALVATVALACGCSTSVPSVTRTASAAPLSAEAASIAGTTNLMSARLSGPAPKVGKAHLAVDELESSDDIESGSTSESDAPKAARRSDGSRRGGGFGSSK